MSARTQFSSTKGPKPVLIADTSIPTSTYGYRELFADDGLSNEMAIDGTVPKLFFLKPVADQNAIVTEIILDLVAAGIDPSSGQQSARFTTDHGTGLANGILIELYRDDGSGGQTKTADVPFAPVSLIRDYAALHQTSDYQFIPAAGLGDLLQVTIKLVGTPLRSGLNDEIRITIQDDLSGIIFTSFRAMGIGTQEAII